MHFAGYERIDRNRCGGRPAAPAAPHPTKRDNSVSRPRYNILTRGTEPGVVI